MTRFGLAAGTILVVLAYAISRLHSHDARLIGALVWWLVVGGLVVWRQWLFNREGGAADRDDDGDRSD